jgi:hypothetical protein
MAGFGDSVAISREQFVGTYEPDAVPGHRLGLAYLHDLGVDLPVKYADGCFSSLVRLYSDVLFSGNLMPMYSFRIRLCNKKAGREYEHIRSRLLPEMSAHFTYESKNYNAYLAHGGAAVGRLLHCMGVPSNCGRKSNVRLSVWPGLMRLAELMEERTVGRAETAAEDVLFAFVDELFVTKGCKSRKGPADSRYMKELMLPANLDRGRATAFADEIKRVLNALMPEVGFEYRVPECERKKSVNYLEGSLYEPVFQLKRRDYETMRENHGDRLDFDTVLS